MYVDTGVYTYFDIDDKHYKRSREIIKIRTNELMYMPVEITSEDGLYNVMTVKLPDPHHLPDGDEIKKVNGYKLMWQLIGFREFSDNVPCIKQFEGTVLMMGSGKMALQRSAHKVRWQTSATLKDGYNEQMLFLRKNYKNIIYSPLHDDGYLPYVSQKGVYIETSIKNKPTYGQDDIANSAVYAQTNSRGILKSTANTNGDGIPCQCDQINIASAHKFKSTTHDNQRLNSIRKVHLIFNRILLREQTEEKWPDIWNQLVCDGTAADTLYTGLMYEGPNFNPRVDTVQIITPADVAPDNTHQTVFESYADDTVKSHAKTIQDKNTLRDSRTLPETQPSTTSDSKPEYLKLGGGGTAGGGTSVNGAPGDAADGSFKDFMNTHGSRRKRSVRRSIFDTGVSDLDDVTSEMGISDILTKLKDCIKYTLINRNRSEEMFSRIEISNDHARNTIGLEYQFVYNKRFKTFVDQGLWETRKLFMYAKDGVQNDIFAHLFDQTTLVQHTFGTKSVKTLTKRSDYLRFMYGSTYNGDTFTTVVNDVADFIEYYCYQLAKDHVVIPSYDELAQAKPPVDWWFDGHGNKHECPYLSKNYLCDYGTHPEFEQRILAYEALLTWIGMMAITLAYMENDANDIQGLHRAQNKVQEFLNSPAAAAITNCQAELKWGMLYFYSLHDNSLLCEYGAISGCDENSYQPHKDNYGYKSIRNTICTKLIVSESRKGHILNFWQMYPFTVFPSTPSEFLTTYYKMWYLLTPTWHHLLERTNEGQQLLALNEIFRGHKTATAFNESVASHNSGNLDSENVYVIPTNVNPQTLFGLIESGPKREYPIEIIRNLTSSNYLKTSEYQDHSLVGLLDDDEAISTEINIVTADMLAKLSAWTYASYYRGLTPKHDKDNAYEFKGMRYQRPTTTTSSTGTTTANVQTDYKLPTRYLGTETVNCSDLIMGCGYGIATIRGSGMYLFNKYIPTEMKTWYDKQNADFKNVFTLSESVQGTNYLTVYRPFLPNISTDNVNVSCEELLKQPF